MDPRPAVVAERLAGVDRIVGVGGSKGGIGKSVVASLLALSAADRGAAVGLFDLDFTSPTDHLVLGAATGFPAEEFGIDPHVTSGVRMMSVAFFSGSQPAPLRGEDTTNALLELLAITRWGDLDLLILDLPPGLGDTTLDLIRLLPRIEYLLVGAGSRLVTGSVERALRLLGEIRVPRLGLVENLRRPNDGEMVADLAAATGTAYLGAIPFDPGLEEALGDPARLRETSAYDAVGRISGAVLA